MIIYRLCPTPSEVRELRLVLRLSTQIVPRIDVLLGIAPIVCLWMICTPPRLGTCWDVWPFSTSKLHKKHRFMLLYLLAMLEYIGAVFRAAAPTPGTPGTVLSV